MITCPKLAFNVPGVCYVILKTPPTDEMGDWVASFQPYLKFTVKDCDPNTGEPDTDEGYEDDYVLEPLDVTVADFVQRAMKANFSGAWEELGPDNELEDTYQLSSMKTLDDAVRQITKFLGLQACERSDKVPDGKSSHTLLLAGWSPNLFTAEHLLNHATFFLSGVFRGGHEVLVRCKLALSDGVTLLLTVRAENADVAELITSTIG